MIGKESNREKILENIMNDQIELFIGELMKHYEVMEERVGNLMEEN